ncbi:hypothetical protein HYU17_04585 [Candidatus Woesearchaeota archaeon]|nr:hypothetical protein [Candidatus Woesearchaeota archaeon]
MEIIADVEGASDEIKRCISRFGHSPEHNYAYLLANGKQWGKPLFLESEGGYGVFIAHNEASGEAFMLSEALAPREKQVELLHEALDTCFSKLGITKLVVDQSEALRAATLKSLRNGSYRALRPSYPLYWPVFDMERWDGDTMSGEGWKKLRNIKNRFYKEHSVEVVDTKLIDREALKKIVSDWIARRRLLSLGASRENSNFIYYKTYINILDLEFEGMKLAKTLVVDGRPCTITAGWETPNSNKGYYSGVGICDYSFEGLGEIANLEDLWSLKKKGYRLVEFGGSTLPLLRFKLKFRPHFAYMTHTYGIVRKN